MKKLLIFFVSLLFVFCVTGCTKDIDHGSEYNRSFKVFENFKKSTANSYQYKVIRSSWVGSSTETILTVRYGRVTNRSCIVKGYSQGSATISVIDEWNEDEATLNSHTNGYPSQTLDEIYQKAKMNG